MLEMNGSGETPEPAVVILNIQFGGLNELVN